MWNLSGLEKPICYCSWKWSKCSYRYFNYLERPCAYESARQSIILETQRFNNEESLSIRFINLIFCRMWRK
ncbi:hypothetical protein T190130A13A_20051 [Tenacibaculum sp. 190130A14a]